mmetsp:Transcript_40610/g.87180  ORF Transcript_40610/g.87180 Transcript_40610/m.87180 type:complete len:111 (-) Transcript_40610:242-574(-)
MTKIPTNRPTESLTHTRTLQGKRSLPNQEALQATMPQQAFLQGPLPLQQHLLPMKQMDQNTKGNIPGGGGYKAHSSSLITHLIRDKWTEDHLTALTMGSSRVSVVPCRIP